MATLAQFWQQERDTNKAALTAVQSDLAAAQKAVIDAKATLQTDAAALDKINGDIAANRAKLATSSVPSEVLALNNSIRDQIIERRRLQGVILDDQDGVVWAQADVDAATSAAARATAKSADADARFAAATDAAAQRQSLKTTLGAAPFSTLKADATAFAGAQQVTDAKAEIDATFPADLQKIALMRYKTRTARAGQLRKSLTDAQDAVVAAAVAKDGLSGGAAKAASDFQRADQALRDFVKTAKQRYDRAVGVISDLQAIKNGTKTPDLLTAQEKSDVAGSGARTTAEGKVEPIDGKLNDLNTARTALDDQILTQIGADVDKLATDPTVQAKRAAVTAATGAVKTAQTTAVTNGDKKTVDEWEAVVQDPTWRVLVDYYDAKATLDELSSTDPATFGPAVDAAEDAYVTALTKANKAQRQSDALSDVVAARSKRLDASTTALSSRMLSAVRGDSF
jgi:hypothetical protein